MAEKPDAVQLVLRLIAWLYQLECEWNQAHIGERRGKLRQRQFARSPPSRERTVRAGVASLAARQSMRVSARTLAHADRTRALLEHAARKTLVKDAIRPAAVGKKNWLFNGTPRCWSALREIYSLVISSSAAAKIRSRTFATCSAGCTP